MKVLNYRDVSKIKNWYWETGQPLMWLWRYLCGAFFWGSTPGFLIGNSWDVSSKPEAGILGYHSSILSNLYHVYICILYTVYCILTSYPQISTPIIPPNSPCFPCVSLWLFSQVFGQRGLREAGPRLGVGLQHRTQRPRALARRAAEHVETHSAGRALGASDQPMGVLEVHWGLGDE